MGLLTKKREPKALRKFDYKIVLLPHSMPAAGKEARLDILGAEGWELIAFNGEQAVLKRLIE